jgi:hypothetical protein
MLLVIENSPWLNVTLMNETRWVGFGSAPASCGLPKVKKPGAGH